MKDKLTLSSILKSLMPIKILSILLLITAMKSNAQNKILIVDSITKKPISGVYLYQKINQKILLLSISDEDGFLISPAFNMQDTLYLFHVSYRKKITLKSEIHTSNSIELSSFALNLGEVSIVALKSNRVKQIGYFGEKGKKVLSSSSPDWVIGNLINIDTTIKWFKIQKFMCEFDKIDFTKARKSNCKIGVIFHFFEVKNNAPNVNEIIDPIIVNYEDLKEKFTRALEYAPVIKNETGAIFLGIEWQLLPCTDNEKFVKQFYLPIRYDVQDNKVWNYNYKSKKWLESKGSLTTGKAGISIEINY
jgi:hypothetical protein